MHDFIAEDGRSQNGARFSLFYDVTVGTTDVLGTG
jgi:hypothetical protein